MAKVAACKVLTAACKVLTAATVAKVAHGDQNGRMLMFYGQQVKAPPDVCPPPPLPPHRLNSSAPPTYTHQI
eukprot:250526-Chlamydomonas_euryale.AAC.3